MKTLSQTGTVSKLIQRIQSETYYDYLDRLFTNKMEYGLDCNKIAELMNKEFDTEFSESKFRKQWRYFKDGREYEKNLKFKKVHKRILNVGDLHVPFNLPVETFSDYRGAIDILVVNGDLVDLAAISSFPKAYRDSPIDEIVKARQYLIDLIEYISPSEVYITVGNHDIRFQSYLVKNIDSDLLELMPNTPIDLIVDDGIRIYDKRSKSKVWYDPLRKIFPDIDFHFDGGWHTKIGSVIFAHSKAYKSGILKTVEAAMDYFLKVDRSPISAVILAHTHRSGDTRIGSVFCYEQGACCQVEKMEYNDGKLTTPQQKGFMFVALDENGDLIYDLTKRILL